MADIDVHYDPITLITDPVRFEIDGLDDMKSTVDLSIRPVQIKSDVSLDSKSALTTDSKANVSTDSKLATDSKLDVVVSQPLKLETSAEIDLKPVVLDQCLSLRVRDLPPTRIHQPYEQKIAFSIFGMELFGISLCGEWQTRINEDKKVPFFAAGGTDRKEGCSPGGAQNDYHDGLRIRLGD